MEQSKLSSLILNSASESLDDIFTPKNTTAWDEAPVNFRIFVESPQHMNFPPLSARQYAVADFLLGNEPKKIFDTGNTVGVLMLGKGCPAKGMRIFSKDAPPVKIEDWIGGNILGYYKKKISSYKSSKSWVSGKGKIYRVTTQHGFSIDVFEGHQFLRGPQKEEWKELRYLKLEDAVAILPDGKTEIYWDKIKKIEFLREDYYYDLEVDDVHNYICEGFVSHNSGKDLISALMILYIVHVLLCMTSPQKFFNMAEGEAIDILNVAANADQASTVFFNKFIERIKRWKWLREKYSTKISGIFLGQAKLDEAEKSVIITKNGVLFPKNIRAFSGNSLETAMEGKNLLCFVADELSAFGESIDPTRGLKMFSMMKSSAVSRFGNRWKGLALSFTRYKGDAITQLYDIAKGELHWYSDTGSTWEIKPAHLFKDYPEKYFELEGQKIPLEFEQEFRLNPTDAKSKYMCKPVEIEQAFMESPEKIEECVDAGRPPVVVLEDYEDSGKVKKRVSYFNLDPAYRDYVLTLDLGLKSDSAALSICHRDVRIDGDYVVQDLITAWTPNMEKSLVVDLTNVEEIILTISKQMHVVGVWFDQWNSSLLSQRLNQAGLFSEIYRLDFQDYKNFKDRIYQGKVRLLQDRGQVTEMKRLVLLKGGKVDHPSGGCFTGDTKVSLLDGREVSFVDLVREYGDGTPFYVYSLSSDKQITVGKAHHPRLTKHNAHLLKITLDNGEVLHCTEDHPFAINYRSRNTVVYLPANKLKIGQSLTPLYRKKSDNHKIVAIEDGGCADVYDLTVDKYDNFALTAGIFVHNSKDRADTVVGAVKLLTGTKAGMSPTVPSPLGGELIMGSNLTSQGGVFL